MIYTGSSYVYDNTDIAYYEDMAKYYFQGVKDKNCKKLIIAVKSKEDIQKAVDDKYSGIPVDPSLLDSLNKLKEQNVYIESSITELGYKYINPLSIHTYHGIIYFVEEKDVIKLNNN